nr:MAG TPA: hypothetical protein [Caudoviricetes sp.]
MDILFLLFHLHFTICVFFLHIFPKQNLYHIKYIRQKQHSHRNDVSAVFIVLELLPVI